jgi:hypothetical protein
LIVPIDAWHTLKLLERSTKDMEIANYCFNLYGYLRTRRSGTCSLYTLDTFPAGENVPDPPFKFASMSLSFQSQTCNLNTYMFIITAAPPKRAATPTAPVFMGMAIPVALELVPAPEALAPPAPLAVAVEVAIAEDGVGIPLVKGTLEALLAPEKAGFCVLADTFGLASGFRGFSTLGLVSDVLV